MSEREKGEKKNTFKVSKDEERKHIKGEPRSSRINEMIRC